MTRSPDLTTAELRVMKALWEVGHGTVAEVRAELGRRGQELAYTTVMTLLGRLAAKGAVDVDKEREPFVYRAAHRRESVLRDRLRDFVREVFDGEADSLVLNLVEEHALSRAELLAIERKIADAERSDARERVEESATRPSASGFVPRERAEESATRPSASGFVPRERAEESATRPSASGVVEKKK
jgi:BlaI family transcriptional regulator, penicillinase repressor